MKTQLKLLAICHLLSALCWVAHAQGTAFTYQGRLNAGGALANGSYDLTFTLYATNVDGSALAGTVRNSAVAVTNGLFTTLVDLGNAFTGTSNWLEIAVSTNGANNFTTLAPRQKMTPVPYAITAGNVISGGLASGTYGNVVSFNNVSNNFTGAFTGKGSGLTSLSAANLTGLVADTNLSANVAMRAGGNDFTGNQTTTYGFVGIGTISPDRPLTIQGIGDNGEWISFQSTNGVTRWHLNNAFGGLNFVQSGVADYRLFISTNGNVGIGVSSPGSALDVAGDVHAGGTFLGDGSGLTNLNAGNVAAGSLAAAQLPANVAFVNSNQTFSGQNNFTQNVGIGTNAPSARLHVFGGSAFFGVDPNSQGNLSASAGLGVRIYYYRNGPASTGTIQAYDYASAAVKPLSLQPFGGNVGINSINPNYPLSMGSGAYCSAAGVWTSVSDRNVKEDFTPITPTEVLAKLAALPITQWKYKVEPGGIKHIGPVAQDFHAAFGLGDNDKAIGSVDEGGVALASIQGLNEKVDARIQEQEARSQKLEKENAELKKELAEIKTMLAKLATK